ncbi:hypothetical protein CCAX7_14510 [Capsulimonas corticalis]|uniref:Uncharacterized protein n=1 Tax=Capsulimonas corticalis TaxID=2219043 RepID=A0A402CZI4_9BACT|nr:hypothetical protein [Capsulimonas corticalis]BDI29400.1 hypothetical protein CCAX7_14510 [Capsulimonas corticalis]
MADFVAPLGHEGYDGVLLFQQVGDTTVYAFEGTNIRENISENAGYVKTIDGASRLHNRVLGIVLGSLTFDFVLGVDRRLDQFLNKAFGPRSTAKNAWAINIIKYGGATPIKAGGVWFQDYTEGASFGVRGEDQLIGCNLRAVICDPHDTIGAPTLAAPATVGTNGVGLSTFGNMSFTDGQVSPTIYDYIESYNYSLHNNLAQVKAMKDPVNRIGAGFLLGMLDGNIALTQTDGAPTNPLPAAVGTYPLQIISPSGDGTHSMVRDFAASYDALGLTLRPDQVNNGGRSYTIFDKAAGATNTPAYPFIASYV